MPKAVAAVLPQIELAVLAGVRALRSGGRIHYFGAGTSGRAAFADAAELRPTFSLEPEQVVAHVAGGLEALWSAVEQAEDDDHAGARDAAEVTAKDLVIGVAASGGTPYVGGRAAARAFGRRHHRADLVQPACPAARVCRHPDRGPDRRRRSSRARRG